MLKIRKIQKAGKESSQLLILNGSGNSLYFLAFFILCFVSFSFAQTDSLLVGTGNAVITNGNAAQAVIVAKKRAMADLASQIKVQVHSEFQHSILEGKSGIDEYTRSKINIITDMEIEGAAFQILKKPDLVQARAVLNKKKARQIYLTKCKDLKTEITQRLANADQFLNANQPQVALPELLKASRLMNALEQSKLIYFALGGASDPALDLPVSHGAIDEKIARILNRHVKSFNDAVNFIAFQLAQQIPSKTTYKVFPFQYEEKEFGSAFSEYLRQELQNALPTYLGHQTADQHTRETALLINGSYWPHSEMMVILAQIQNKQGIITGNARVEVPMNLIKALGVSYKPENFEQALQDDDQYFDPSQVVYGDLNLSVWTNHGSNDLLFKEGEHMKIYVRVNHPAYIRCIYHLANGQRTPLVDNFYIDPTMVNKPIEISQGFDLICAPPFGVERMQVFASTEKFPALRTKKITISGQTYPVLSEPFHKFITSTRGFIRKPMGIIRVKKKSAERVITVTTIPAHNQ